jgi:outer membrane receptor protein involved in Fe transport
LDGLLWGGLLVRKSLYSIVFLGLLSAAAAQSSSPITGTVTDSRGAAIRGASVRLQAGSLERLQTTNANGEFSFPNINAREATVTVSAVGFADEHAHWTSDASPLAVVLQPATVAQQVTVTANRVGSRVVETPTSVVVLSSQDVASTAAYTVDDMLRQVPGFTLFRRTSSRTSNPTSQGVSLRGLGASGASRALVLADGFPLNDPFGGWVYWDRVPREEISHIEVASGGASHLYGSDALGGVINIFRKPMNVDALSVELAGGNEDTPDLSLAGTKRIGQWGFGVDSDLFRTHGYVAVPESLRGTVDTRVNSQHATGDVSVARDFAKGQVFARTSLFGESRHNGTPLQTNSTTIRELDLGGNWTAEALGRFDVRGYASNQDYYQTFSQIASDRSSETLVRIQRVPAQRIGFSAQWTRPLGNRQSLLAGFEEWNVHGQTNEFITATGTTSHSGGREANWAGYGEDIVRITPSWLLTLSGRVDHWLNFAAFSPSSVLPDRSETFFSPRAALLHKLTGHLSLTASGYRSFRAPTLNELYRSFRLGSILTLANDNLRAERLTGGEAGAIVTGLNERVVGRANCFWSDITRAVANVTISSTPALITRQRENLGRTRSRGVELETSAQVTSAVNLSAGYEYTDASVTQGDPALIGKRIPQIPRNQFEFQARYSNGTLLAGLQARFGGEQFDDDVNSLLLRRYFIMDGLVSYRIRSGVEVFAAVENLLNQRYDTGRTPVLTQGPPALARVGLRLRFGAR